MFANFLFLRTPTLLLGSVRLCPARVVHCPQMRVKARWNRFDSLLWSVRKIFSALRNGFPDEGKKRAIGGSLKSSFTWYQLRIYFKLAPPAFWSAALRDASDRDAPPGMLRFDRTLEPLELLSCDLWSSCPPPSRGTECAAAFVWFSIAFQIPFIRISW